MLITPRLDPAYTELYRLFRANPKNEQELIELKYPMGTRVHAWDMQVTPLTDDSMIVRPNPIEERHASSQFHTSRFEGLTDQPIHTLAREYGINPNPDATPNMLAPGPQIGDIFIRWEHPRSKLTGYPLPGRELTVQYGIEEIFNGGGWHRFTLALVEEAQPEFKPQWHVAYICPETHTQFIQVPSQTQSGATSDRQLTLMVGEPVRIHLDSLLDKNSEGTQIRSYVPPGFEIPQKDADGETFERRDIQVPVGLTLNENLLTGTPTKVATRYLFLRAVNRAGTDTGCLKITVVSGDPNALPYWNVGRVETAFKIREGNSGVDLAEYINLDARSNATYHVPLGAFPSGVTLTDKGILQFDALMANPNQQPFTVIVTSRHRTNTAFEDALELHVSIS